MAGDLHSHSTFSDGSLAAKQLVQLAARAKLKWLSISDHDSMQSVHFAYKNPVQQGVNLMPATELTAYDFERKHRVHILCYWPDPSCPKLKAHCRLMAQRRNEACMKSARQLEKMYPQFKAEDAMELAQGGVLYKAAIMQVLYRYGLADGIYKETYKELFGFETGKVLHNPQYEPVQQVLGAIHEAKGVAVIAHPSVYKSMPLVEELAARGDIDGVEIEHPRNTPHDKLRLYQLAAQHNLIVTGGTDFHGMNMGTPRPLGTCTTAPEQIQKLCSLATARKGHR